MGVGGCPGQAGGRVGLVAGWVHTHVRAHHTHVHVQMRTHTHTLAHERVHGCMLMHTHAPPRHTCTQTHTHTCTHNVSMLLKVEPLGLGCLGCPFSSPFSAPRWPMGMPSSEHSETRISMSPNYRGFCNHPYFGFGTPCIVVAVVPAVFYNPDTKEFAPSALSHDCQERHLHHRQLTVGQKFA